MLKLKKTLNKKRSFSMDISTTAQPIEDNFVVTYFVTHIPSVL